MNYPMVFQVSNQHMKWTILKKTQSSSCINLEAQFWKLFRTPEHPSTVLNVLKLLDLLDLELRTILKNLKRLNLEASKTSYNANSTNLYSSIHILAIIRHNDQKRNLYFSTFVPWAANDQRSEEVGGELDLRVWKSASEFASREKGIRVSRRDFGGVRSWWIVWKEIGGRPPFLGSNESEELTVERPNTGERLTD